MRAVVVVLGLFFFTLGLRAQSPREDVFNYPLRPETLNAFTMTCTRLAEHPLIKGYFEQEKTLSRLNRSLKSSGNFIIAAGQGMVWDTAKPFPSTLVLGKDYLIQSRPGGQKTALSAQGNETFIRFAEVISTVFSGHAQGLLENFEVYYSYGASAGTGKEARPGASSGVSGSGAWELGLSPVDRAIGTFAERIIMKGDTVIRYIELHEQSGDTVKYTLSNHLFPIELNANEKALFSFP